MNNSIFAVLFAYGFQPRFDGLFWGTGSMTNGCTVVVSVANNNQYTVKFSRWAYDSDGEPMIDTRETRILYGALALEWIFSIVPAEFWRR